MPSGEIIRLGAWMLDSLVCAEITLGAPRVTVSALTELHQLLIEHGFRRSSVDDPTIVQEQQYEQLPDTGTVIGALRQLRIPFDSPMLSPDKPVGAQHRARPAGQSLVGSGLDRRA